MHSQYKLFQQWRKNNFRSDKFKRRHVTSCSDEYLILGTYFGIIRILTELNDLMHNKKKFATCICSVRCNAEKWYNR